MLLRVIKDLFKSQSDQEKEGLEAVQLFVKDGQYQSACELLELLLQRNPTHVTCHWELAQCYYKMGDNAKAMVHCETTRTLDPQFTPAFTLLSQLRLPGDDYQEVLSRIINHLKPRTYVEIGVFRGASLRLAKVAKCVIGIDPEPRIDWELEPHMKVFKQTSDDFFAQHDLMEELGNRCVDLAFIDGMHQFDFVLRDFANIERCCTSNSVVLIHDCYPLDEESAGREPRSSYWSGDVWRFIVLLKKYRPDLQINTIGTAPTGLAVIQNLNPESGFDKVDHAPMVAEMMALPYSYLNEDKAAKLNLFINHWPRVKSMVRTRPR